MRIGAAIFNADHSQLAIEVSRLERAGIDFIHFDVFDGNFVSDLGFSPKTIASLRPRTTLPFEVHLGVRDPGRLARVIVQSGANKILTHVESMHLPYETLYKMREEGIETGLAVALGTPISAIVPLLTMVDTVLLLSRFTGEGGTGATFNSLVLDKVTELQERRVIGNHRLEIQVAGSVKESDIPQLARLGVDAVAFGGTLYSAGDMNAKIIEIRKLSQRK